MPYIFSCAPEPDLIFCAKKDDKDDGDAAKSSLLLDNLWSVMDVRACRRRINAGD